MAGLSEVFESLRTMTQLQLLLAFVACIGYAFGQGRLLARKGQRLAWFATALAATGFAFESDDWTHAIVLLGFALAGMGSFVAVVWLICRAIGLGPQPAVAQRDATDSQVGGVLPSETRPLPSSPRDHAHSL